MALIATGASSLRFSDETVPQIAVACPQGGRGQVQSHAQPQIHALRSLFTNDAFLGIEAVPTCILQIPIEAAFPQTPVNPVRTAPWFHLA